MVQGRAAEAGTEAAPTQGAEERGHDGQLPRLRLHLQQKEWQAGAPGA